MILLTVGTQMPFDRLVEYVDQWVSDGRSKETRVVAQVGASDFKSEKMTVLKSVEPEQFEKYLTECDFIVSHAGMGAILTALRMKKPIVIFPRKASLGEHRNDHQLATVRSFSKVGGVYVAATKDELYQFLNNSDELASGVLENSEEYKKLLSNLTSLTQ